ncbi:MAG: hypothetical protein H6666_06710 [Ardenticatenaceae bacterium]|nr:hypothetical protein [Anaerolineales bacterium]MCB8917596.1 hypothetical protein [Ardenticatenaceae bacterium]
MKRVTQTLILAGLLGLLLTACSLIGGEPEATATPEPTTEVSTPVPPASEPVIGTAPVDTVDVLVLESFPVQVNVIASGNLPDGCTRLEEPTIAQADTTFTISLPTSRPGDAVCTEALEPYDKVIPLDVAGLPAGSYTVSVNGVSASFTLAVANEAPTAEATAPPVSTGSGAISGQVWHDLCAIGGEGGEPAIPSEGCITTPSGGFEANGALETGEPGLEGVQVSLGRGACPATGLAATTTDANGFYSFTGLEAGTYCISIDPLVEPNVSILIPGKWTFPAIDGVAEATVNVVTNQVSPNINFGWDFQFAPNPDELAAANCTDAAIFVADVNVIDDTVLPAGSTFTKTWRLANSGTCTWTTDYALVFVGGDQMSGPNEQPLTQSVPPSTTLDITVELVVPTVNGTYRGDWMLRNADGTRFGIPEPDIVFWVQIAVLDGTDEGAALPGPVGGFLLAMVLPAGAYQWHKRRN